uniref:C2H2-type domain-containing protein n=1 Tax=Spongospora subterranea TaxID=70186 RepID=A0A0H5QIW1_9EUKA|eukprot:CRZ01933.1 hypothetical protein [Spongospora subterranea]
MITSLSPISAPARVIHHDPVVCVCGCQLLSRLELVAHVMLEHGQVATPKLQILHPKPIRYLVASRMNSVPIVPGQFPAENQCQVCLKEFSSRSVLHTHELIHTGAKPHTCGQCGRGFTQRGSLNTHMRIHLGLRPFSCTICGRAFSRRLTLERHLQTHTGAKPYRCPVCAKGMTRKHVLKEHMRACHCDIAPFQCIGCKMDVFDVALLGQVVSNYPETEVFPGQSLFNGLCIKCSPPNEDN